MYHDSARELARELETLVGARRDDGGLGASGLEADLDRPEVAEVARHHRAADSGVAAKRANAKVEV